MRNDTRIKICDQYKVNDGYIVSPGKYEGEAIYIPYFHEMALHGFANETDYGPDEYSTVYDYFDVIEKDVELFPELRDITRVCIWEDDNGFVNSFTE